MIKIFNNFFYGEILKSNYKRRWFLLVVLILVCLSVGGYFAYQKFSVSDSWKKVDINNQKELEAYWKTDEYIKRVTTDDASIIADELLHYLRNDDQADKILTRKHEDILYGSDALWSSMQNIKIILEKTYGTSGIKLRLDDFSKVKLVKFEGNVTCSDKGTIRADGTYIPLFYTNADSLFSFTRLGVSPSKYNWVKSVGWDDSNFLGFSISKVEGEYKLLSGKLTETQKDVGISIDLGVSCK